MQISLHFKGIIQSRLAEASPLIQVIMGPRQVGKTTTMQQVTDALPKASRFHFASADAVFNSDWSWVERQWLTARMMGPSALLILDEIQKIENWSEIIKKLWDESIYNRSPIKVLLLGSSSLALQTGLSESLSGRFELIRAYHWNFLESREAFDYSLEEYLCFGGYPGANPFKNDLNRWLEFIKSSIVETVLEKDISRLRRIARPSLFRQVFELLCSYPAAELSLRKLVGQLQDPGSIETIKHYIELLEGAFLVKTLQKYSTNPIQKKSSPLKILPLCPALCTFARGEAFISLEERGHLFELIVGCDLLRLPGELFYWRSEQSEVDYVYKVGNSVTAIEVKSGRKKSLHGLVKFKALFESASVLIITPENYLEFASNPGVYIASHRT